MFSNSSNDWRACLSIASNLNCELKQLRVAVSSGDKNPEVDKDLQETSTAERRRSARSCRRKAY